MCINSKPNIIIHLLGSALFMLFAFIASPDWPNIREMLNNPMGRIDVVFQAELLLFFYFNYYYLLDKFYFRKKYLVYFLITVLFLVIAIPVTDTLMFNIGQHRPHHHRGGPPVGMGGPSFLFFLFTRRFYLFLLVLVGSVLVKTMQRLKHIEQQKTNTELSFLKAQINPHFLFNTLNSIYSLSLQKADGTPDAIVKLSGMMRYVLRDAQNDFVPLESEINYIKDFIELQKLRLDNSVKLKVTYAGELEGKTIAPLILISFVENAFKHGINSEENSEIEIDIKCVDNNLHFFARNNKVKTTLASEKTGVGMVNSRKRLELLYPSKYSLIIKDGDKDFSVTLMIKLDA